MMFATQSSVMVSQAPQHLQPHPYNLECRLSQGSIRKLESKEDVYCEGDPRTHVFRVEQGVISVYKMLADGHRRIIDFAYPGDIIGLGVLDEHILSAQAVCPSKVRCLSAGALQRDAAADPNLAITLYGAVCQELAAAQELLVTVAQGGAVEKVATFLLKLHRRIGEPGHVVTLHMRRSDIGDLLGLTIESISRALTKLRAMGVIDVGNGGTKVRFRDLRRLQELANE